MNFTSDQVIQILAQRGTMFLIDNGVFTANAPGHHTFVACNSDDPEKVVILAVATGQVQKVIERLELRGFSYDTMVSFGADDYPNFDRPTAFNCNEAIRTDMTQLAQLHAQGKLRPVTSGTGKLTDEHMALIEAGIILSAKVTPDIKAIVTTATAE